MMKTIVLIISLLLLHPGSVRAEVIEGVAAYMDDMVITLSEFKVDLERLRKTAPNLTPKEALNSMINRALLLREAKKMKIDSSSNDDLLKDYINLKIGALILIKEDAVAAFYRTNINEFKGRDYLVVRDEIEGYLFELEVNEKLKEHLTELRAVTDIKIHIKY